jgi:hypothetical protein
MNSEMEMVRREMFVAPIEVTFRKCAHVKWEKVYEMLAKLEILALVLEVWDRKHNWVVKAEIPHHFYSSRKFYNKIEGASGFKN